MIAGIAYLIALPAFFAVLLPLRPAPASASEPSRRVSQASCG